MEQYPVLKQSGNARLSRKLKGMRYMPSQAVGKRPAFSKAVVELTNGSRKNGRPSEAYEGAEKSRAGFCGKRCARSNCASAPRKSSYQELSTANPAIHQPRPSERRVIHRWRLRGA